MSDDYAEIDAEYVRETEMAFLMDTAEGERWIPKSVCGEMDEDAHTLEVATWFAEKEGLV